MPAAIPAVIAAAGAVGGAAISSSGAKSAAKTQARSADAAVAEQQRQFDITQANQAPWLAAGRNALTQLQDPAANFAASPDYDFRKTQGMQGIERTAAARGGAFSGNALRALNEFNSNLASSEFGNWWNRQAGLAGVGQASANTLANYGQQTANNVGNALMSQGDARASGIAASSNAMGRGLSDAINSWMYFKPTNYGGGAGAGLGSSYSNGLNNTTYGQWNPNSWGRP